MMMDVVFAEQQKAVAVEFEDLMVVKDGDAGGAVLYTEQTLTEVQQLQVRKNINALGGDDLPHAIDTALTKAKESGAFDGADGSPGAPGPQGPQGEQGLQGPAGADGYSPVKGEDYWTAEDKAEIVHEVLAALPAAEGVSY